MALDKDFLDAIEIDEKHINKILKEHDKEIKSLKSEHNKKLLEFTDYAEIKENYNKVIEELDALKKTDPSKLQEDLKALGEKHKIEIDAIKKNSTLTIKKMAIKNNLQNDTKDSDLVLSLLDLDKITVDDNGSVIAGLNEQTEILKKEKSFLFNLEDPKMEGTRPAETDTNIKTENESDSFLDAVKRGAGL